jgi:hypothetical protein
MSLRRIQKLLGHKGISTTERYSHLSANGLQPYYVELAACVIDGFVTRSCNKQASGGGYGLVGTH